MYYKIKYYNIYLIFRKILVLVESIASGHKLIRIRDRVADKLEEVYFDPYGKFILKTYNYEFIIYYIS